jgi:hypothetical protein
VHGEILEVLEIQDAGPPPNLCHSAFGDVRASTAVGDHQALFSEHVHGPASRIFSRSLA